MNVEGITGGYRQGNGRGSGTLANCRQNGDVGAALWGSSVSASQSGGAHKRQTRALVLQKKQETRP
jgi:hypothetical protein